MPRTETYLLRLTKDEKDELAQRAKLQGISIAKLIRQKLNLDAPRTYAGKPAAQSTEKVKTVVVTSDWKDLLPPT